MRWTDLYQSRTLSADAALADLRPGATVYVGGNAATPRHLAAALVRRAQQLDPQRPITVAHVLLLAPDPFAAATDSGHLRHLAWFVGPADRGAVAAGRCDYVPINLSEIPFAVRSGRPPLDVALLQVAPPDDHGFLSLGVEVLASLAAAEVARKVVVQVNPRMPRVYGDAFLHVSQVHAIVEAEEPLIEHAAPTPSPTERAIAEHIVDLVPQGATLQLGIGGVPNAVVELLEGRDDLGVHSEMISDGVMRAVEAGTVTGRFKSHHRRKVVTTFCMGSQRFYAWLNHNAAVEAHPADYTNDIAVASAQHRLVSINSALSVDLTGQVNADSLGPRIYSGIGGQLDFVRAARRSVGGRSILALPSTAKRGTVSRIVRCLAEGAGVVTPRGDVDTVVTEFGVAELAGRTLAERAEALRAIAHPDFRSALESR